MEATGSVDADCMEIQSNGASMIQDARRRLDQAADKLVKDPTDVDQLVAVQQAVDQGKVGVKLIQAEQKLSDSLLDIFI